MPVSPPASSGIIFLPGPQKWMRVYQWEEGSFPDIRLHFLALPCYHCAKPACARACPNKAIYKEEKYGAVLIDPKKCTGNRKCWQACPYGAIVFPSDDRGAAAGKCTMCLDRLEEGKKPICVLSCSLRALEFGPLDQLRTQFGDLQQLEEFAFAADHFSFRHLQKARSEKNHCALGCAESSGALAKKRALRPLPCSRPAGPGRRS